MTHSEKIICGVFSDAYIALAEADLAEQLEAIWRALDTSKTWGDFRAMMPKDAFDRIWSKLEFEFEDEGKPLPDMAEAFDRERVPGHADGDWPKWPAAEMLNWMPDEIQQKYGRRESTTFNGDFLEIAPEHLNAVMQDLQTLGYECVHDEALIAKICGHGQW